MKPRLKRAVAGLLAGILTSLSLSQVVFATGQMDSIGTRAALGSPLISDGFTQEEWDPWEMLCFGIFLSNFCNPFVDDYYSAFSDGATTGSKGKGLEALQFSTGGDSQANAYLNDMLKYCISNQSQGARSINVKYNVYEYGEKQDGFELGTRRAYFDDLIPELRKYKNGTSIGISKANLFDHPVMTYEEVELTGYSEYANKYISMSANGTIGDVGYGQDTFTTAILVRDALLPEFYVGNSANTQSTTQVQQNDQTGATTNTTNTTGEQTGTTGSNVVFDLANGYDTQILTALLAKTFNSDTAGDTNNVNANGTAATKAGLDDYLGQKYPLYFDGFGNICIQKDNRFIVVIPASANCHLTKSTSYNLVNSLILNNFVLSDTDMKVTRGVIEGGFANAGGGTGSEARTVLGGALAGDLSSVSSGKVLTYFTTDSNVLEYVYNAARKNVVNSTRDTTVDDNVIDKEFQHKYADLQKLAIGKTAPDGGYSAGDSMFQLLSDEVINKQPFHIGVTGIKTEFKEAERAHWYSILPTDRNPEDRTIDITLAALGTIGFMSPTNLANDNTLMSVSQFNASGNVEDTIQPIFDIENSIYTLPSKTASSTMKQYFNYVCHLLDKTKSYNSQYGLFDADEQMSFLEQTKDALDLNLRLLVSMTQDITNMFPSSTATHQLGDSNKEVQINSMVLAFVENYYEIKKGSNLSDIKSFSGLYGAVEKDGAWLEKGPKRARIKSGYTAYFDPVISKAWYNKMNIIAKPIVVDSNLMPDDVPEIRMLLSQARILKPEPYFTVASQVFGVDEGVQFKLYTPQIYLSYLTFYGLMDNDTKANKFNENLFKGSDFLKFTAENFESAKTEEQREAEVKLNVYKLLSLDKAGDAYRDAWFDKILRTLFVKPFDKSLNNENSIIGEKTKLLSLESAENNALTGAILGNWDTIAITIFIVIAVIAIMSGLLNRRSFMWHLSILVTIAGTIMIIPYYLDLSPMLCNKFINSTFKEGSTYWALAESIRTNQQEEQVNAIQSDDAKVKALLTQLNLLDTDSTLMVKQDISRKVIDKLGIEGGQEAIQRNKTLRFLLPVMMEQISQEGGGYDYVSIPITQLYNNWANTYLKYKDTAYVPTTYKPEYSKEKAESLTVAQKQETRFEGYIDCSEEGKPVNDISQSITRIKKDEDLVHTQFYMIDGYFAPSPYTETRGGSPQLSIKDWINMSKNIKEIYAGGTDNNSLLERWKNSGSEDNSGLQHDITQYNRYDSFTKQSFGYFYTTEGLGTYFYTVLKDTFGEGDGAGKTPASILLNLQGNLATKDTGEQVRTSFMHQGDTGYLRDFLDMEEVFSNVIPYLYQMQTLACGDGQTKGLLGKEKITESQFYTDNYASWAFRSNWVTKIYEDSLYGASEKVVYTDKDGLPASALVKNVSDPRCYPADRPMVFSEAQMHQQGLTEKDLTITELKCLKLGEDVEKRWTTLINYSTLDGLDSEVLYRTMAMESWIAFNKTFTNDNFFVSAKTLYPNSYDLRDISFITLFRSMLSQLTGSVTYMNTNTIADQIYTDFGLFIMWLVQFTTLCLRQIFPFFRELFLMLQLVLAIVTVILNVTSPYKNRIKAAIGWGITTIVFSGVTMLYYWILSWSAKDPTADTLISVSKLFGTFGSGFSLVGWCLGIILATFAYAFFVFYFNYCLIRGKHGLSLKDGAFGFYYTVSNKMFGALGNKLQSGFDKLHKGGGVHNTTSLEAEKKPIKTTVENDKNNPAKAKIEGGEVGTSPTGHEYNESRERKQKDLNISATEVGDHQTTQILVSVTNKLNQEVEKGKELDKKERETSKGTDSKN